jgi:energy-converting hydrogenase Eha subunit B
VYQSAWNPTSRNGPIASQVTLGGNTDTANDSGYSCNLGYEDSTTVVHASTVAAQVIQPCWAIGGSCSYSVTYYDTGGGSCDPSTGQVTGGYDGKGHASVSPASAGTWSGSNGNYTFTRTATGTVTVDVYSEYQQGKATQQKSGGYRCSYSYSSSLTESFRIQSV